MSYGFTKIYIVRKLNDVHGSRVGAVCNTIASAATSALKYPAYKMIGDPSDIDADTLVIAVGGDGTMLEAMRLAANKGAIATGINLGKVGFLTDFANTDKLFDELFQLFHDPDVFPVEHRMALRYAFSADYQFQSDIVFNEYVISNLYSDGIIRYHLEIDDVDAGWHKANGVIVGTPTGSTAYTLSNGGGLLYPSLNIMQIVPVAPLSMSSRPIIVPGDAEVRITVETQGTWVMKGDGVRCFESESTSEAIEITQYPDNTRILHTKEWNFFNMLTNKLNWKAYDHVSA